MIDCSSWYNLLGAHDLEGVDLCQLESESEMMAPLGGRGLLRPPARLAPRWMGRSRVFFCRAALVEDRVLGVATSPAVSRRFHLS